MPTSFSEKENRVFEQAILALRDFRITFGRELKPDGWLNIMLHENWVSN